MGRRREGEAERDVGRQIGREKGREGEGGKAAEAYDGMGGKQKGREAGRSEGSLSRQEML